MFLNFKTLSSVAAVCTALLAAAMSVVPQVEAAVELPWSLQSHEVDVVGHKITIYNDPNREPKLPDGMDEYSAPVEVRKFLYVRGCNIFCNERESFMNPILSPLGQVISDCYAKYPHVNKISGSNSDYWELAAIPMEAFEKFEKDLLERERKCNAQCEKEADDEFPAPLTDEEYKKLLDDYEKSQSGQN
ncbi:hypothetical protein BGX23_003158 [Mortierella sp. AD031]|nr:hypothetical protein BGX23_003158 [Mortierella sp. AD031]